MNRSEHWPRFYCDRSRAIAIKPRSVLPSADFHSVLISRELLLEFTIRKGRRLVLPHAGSVRAAPLYVNYQAQIKTILYAARRIATDFILTSKFVFLLLTIIIIFFLSLFLSFLSPTPSLSLSQKLKTRHLRTVLTDMLAYFNLFWMNMSLGILC